MRILANFRWPRKQRSKRWVYDYFEIRKLVLKSLISNVDYSWSHKLYFMHLFTRYPINSSTSRYRTFCLRSLYSRAIFKFVRLSRHSLKYYINNGFITGFRRSSF